MTAERLDIFKVLKSIDSGDFDYYDNLTEDELKSLPMVVLSRWMSCTKNVKQLNGVNNLVNPFVFKYGVKHKKLLYYLMLVASSGSQKNYKWVPRKKKGSSTPIACAVVAEYYGMSSKDAANYIKSTLDVNDVISCASALGYEDKEITKIKNELK